MNNTVSINEKQVLSFVRFMNGLERTKKDDYFLFKHPNINDRWLTEKELLDLYLKQDKDELFHLACIFAEEIAQVIYQIKIEGEFLYEMEEYSPEFAESIVEDPFHSKIMQKQIQANILLGIVHKYYVPNEDGVFEYDVDMMNEASFMEGYITELWNNRKK